MSNRTPAVVVAVAVLLAAVGPAAVAAVATVPAAESTATQPNETGNASLGASISSFMQASAADAEGEVEDGVFRARAANASNETRRVMVTQRTETLADRLERLRAERQALLDGNGNLTVAERARAARLAAEIRSLREAVETTDEVATAAGVNREALDRLRKNASELDGGEVAELAGEVADSPSDSERGPPGERETESETEQENETETESESETETETPDGVRTTPGDTTTDTDRSDSRNENAPDESSDGDDTPGGETPDERDDNGGTPDKRDDNGETPERTATDERADGAN
ncbi:hypothetical protein [Halosegnis sp.]|uniref:hypothetical protein n=1 Tax=Halosegnis sp. TaxID=2864959 RepID=UPI0035D47AB0